MDTLAADMEKQGELLIRILQAVSYTHLDVYKRQVIARRRRSK